MQNIVLASRDPGSANMLTAAHWLLTNEMNNNDFNTARNKIFRASFEKIHSTIISWGPANQVWENYDTQGSLHDILIWPEENTLSIEQEKFMISLFLDSLPTSSTIITGLDDLDGFRTRIFWEESRTRGFPVFIITDNDINITQRLIDQNRNAFFPDRIFLSHPKNELEISDYGICSSQIVDLGNIHHLRLKHQTSSLKCLRSEWGCKEDDFIVLFISLVGRELVHTGRTVDFDEVVLLEDLVMSLCKNKVEEHLNVSLTNPVLVVRPHPREDKAKFSWLLNMELPFRVVIDRSPNPSNSLHSADLIVGLPCSLLEEAEMKGLDVHLLSHRGIK